MWMPYDFFVINFFPVVGIVFMMVFLWRNSNLERHLKKQFYRLAFFVAAEVVIYNLELILPYTCCNRLNLTLITALGYTLRPVLLYLLISIIIRDDNRKRLKIPLMIPIFVCAVFSFSAFFTSLTYHYDEQNVFHLGLWKKAKGDQHPDRDRQIKAGAFFSNIRRRQIDRHPLDREL